ncbi:MAG: BolA/IbaG family iron-sulfur metabolism protein [Candidatus Dasytiphilus stammeri]
MDNNEIKNLIIKASFLKSKNVYITGDSQHLQIIAISDNFLGMSRVQKEQIIYAPLMKYIINKKIHSISIKTYSFNEWSHKKSYLINKNFIE